MITYIDSFFIINFVRGALSKSLFNIIWAPSFISSIIPEPKELPFPLIIKFPLIEIVEHSEGNISDSARPNSTMCRVTVQFMITLPFNEGNLTGTKKSMVI